MATISDIAQKANVSRALVSRVLNNKSGVSPENREKILRIIKELNYTPNALARALVTQKTQTIGVVMDDLCEDFFFDLIKGMHDMGDSLGYNMIFCSGRDNQEVKFKYVDYFLNGRTDGVIAFGSRIADLQVFIEIFKRTSNFVLIEGDIPDQEYNGVQLDNRGGAYRATQHLIKLGYSKIWHVTGNMDYKVSIDRKDGYLDAMKKSERKVSADMIIEADFSEDMAYENIKELLKNESPPDAFFVGADKTAFGVIRALTEHGIRVPEDVAIIGFDGDKPDSYGIKFPILTTMRQPLYEIGQKGVELLVRSIQDDGHKPEKIVVEPEFIFGETCPEQL